MDTAAFDRHISLSRVAELANTTSQAVSNWRRRFEDFPQPAAGTDRRPLFDLEEMTQWLKTHGRYDDNPRFSSRLLAFMDGLRVALPPADALQVALSAVAWRHLSQKPAEAGFSVSGHDVSLPAELRLSTESPSKDEFTALVGSLTRWAESALEDPYGSIFDPLLEALPRGGETFMRIAIHGLVTAPSDAADLEQTLDDLVNRSGSQDMLARTHPVVRSLAEAVLDVEAGSTVLDPACGSGSVLLQVADEHPGTRRIGVEVNEHQLFLAAISAVITGKPLELHRGNSMESDPVAGLMADRVFIDPPLGVRIRDPKTLQGDMRWRFGVPTVDYDFAWVQHALAHLEEDGKAVVVLPPSALFSGQGRQIRAALLRSAAVEAVITLPKGLYPGTGIAPTFWLLGTPSARTGAAVEGVLLIDASEEDVSEPGALDWVGQVVNERRWRQPLSVGRPRAGVIPAIDLISEEANLTPSRWLTESATPDQGTLDRKVSEIMAAVHRMASRSPIGPLRVVSTGVPLAKMADLVDAKSLKIVQGRHVRPDALRDSGTVRVLTPGLLTGTSSDGDGTKYLDAEAAESGPPLSRPGDIAVWADSSGIHAVVIREGGDMPHSKLQLVRVLDGTFDPDYLAACIASRHNSRFTVGSVTMRVRIQDFEVPSLHPVEQQDLSRITRQIADFQERSREVAAELAELSGLVADAIGEGAVRAG